MVRLLKAAAAAMRQHKHAWFVLFVLAILGIDSGYADKDSNRYPWGQNPNVDFKMYWKDSSNVLQDLNEFQALYIKVHGCA
jgi:hypothetical protein